MASTYKSIRDIDWPLLLITLAISAVGVLQIYSATHETKWRDAWWKQIMWVGAGLLFFWVISQIDYHTLMGQAYVMYGLSIAGLVAIFFIGTRVFGSRRWIPLPGGFQFQVSEFVKIVIILLLARYLTELKKDQLDWRDLLKVAALVGLPMLLVMKQPDLGTSLTYLPVLIGGVFLAGSRWKYIAVIALAVGLALPWRFTSCTTISGHG
jgi:rod shape determining protein RodA